MIIARPLLTAVFFMAFVQSAWAQGSTIDGTLRDDTGKPLNQTQIVLQDGQGKTVATVNSDAQGHYSFSSVPSGSYVVMAMQGDSVLGSTTASVLGTEPVTKDLTLHADQALSIVIARREQVRNALSPQTGTNAYVIDNKSIEALPMGEDTSVDKILEQAPGVAQDSYGQVHVRGEHADLQYRLNGILLPEGISGFGQTLDPRMIESATLLDGALPAQYGYRTAGIVDIQTKNGFANGGSADISGGSHGTIQPSVTYAGTSGSTDYFFAASHLSSDLGIESPTSAASPVHDHTEQNKQFGYGSYMINPMQRIEVIAGNSISTFQIPNNPGQSSTFTDGSISSFNSSQLNERQFESNQYATVAWQGGTDGINMQVAPYIRSSETHFRPDPVGDLIFNGIASDVSYNDLAVGLQNDNSWRINSNHTLRGGFSLQQEHVTTDNTSQVFAGGLDASGNPFQSGTTPETIIDNHQKDGQLYGIYMQDEWKLTDKLTMNYGARFDVVNAYVDENQLSPRLGLVYKYDDDTTFHAGYARYFTPPALELVASSTVALFNGTTNQSPVTTDDKVKAERSHNFDIGATHQLTDEIKLGVDGYYKLVHDLLDEGQFGTALVYTPFNYQHGYIYGSEVTATYTTKDINAYVNFAFSRAMGEDIVSSQFNFTDPAELAYISSHYVHLDHDQTYTASGGISYQVLPKTAVDLDAIFGSGLRNGFANQDSLPWYTQFDTGVTEDLDLFANDKTALRFTVINLFDTSYELRDGTGIGVGAPQYGPRRGFFVGLTQKF